MRDILNLQALKRSKKRKHNTIYDKAVRIISEKHETPELSEDDILEFASNYPTLKVSVLIGGDILIKSKKDTWLIRDEIRFYTLYHKGSTLERGRMKDVFHVQDIFYDIDFIFASIISHDDYTMGIVKRNTQDLLNMVGESRVN